MLRKSLITLSILLLLFNSIGAVYGGLQFILDPTGSSMNMPVSWLQHTLFSNYLIPGIILLLANGLLGFVVIALILLKSRFYPMAISAEGCILFGWITIQAILIRNVSALHIVFWLVALSLIICGIVISKQKRNR